MVKAREGTVVSGSRFWRESVPHNTNHHKYKYPKEGLFVMSFVGSSSQSGSHALQKYPIRRLEPSIQKFLKVLEIDLDRLHRHRINIEKMIVHENWKELNKEQVNASRTVQQIKANIREIERARSQTLEEDLHMFDEKVEGMKEKAIRSIEAFTTETVIPNSDSSSSSPSTPSPSADIASTSLPASFRTHQIQLHVVPIESEAATSWETLQENLVDLNEVIQEFASMVDSQGEKIDCIEDNIENAQQSVEDGTLSLGKAAKYKAAILPVAGAVLGGVVGGPIGLVAGAKIGGLAGLTAGGITGFLSGNVIKKRQDNINEVEMNNLSRKTASSDPNVAAVGDEVSSYSSYLPWNWSSSRTKSESSKDDP